MTKYVMRRAITSDLDAVMSLLKSRQTWLFDQGLDQWAKRDFTATMMSTIRSGLTWLMNTHDGVPVGTITLSTVADQDFWEPSDFGYPALYVTKMATDPEVAGQGVGELLLNWARYHAYTAYHVMWIRWDVWRTNTRLQEYYRSLGATHLRTANISNRNSGALFEVVYKTSLDGFDERVVTEDNSVADIEISVSSKAEGAMVFDESNPSAEGQYHTHLVHVVNGLFAPAAFGSEDGPTEQFELQCDGAGTTGGLLYDPGIGWHIHTMFAKQITEWSGMPELVTGHPYLLKHREKGSEPCEVILHGYQTK